MKDNYTDCKEHLSCQNTWRGKKYKGKDPRIIKRPKKKKRLLTDHFMEKKKRKKREKAKKLEFLTKSVKTLCSVVSAA